MSQRTRWRLGVCLFLLAATLGLYAQVGEFDFIGLDDSGYVSDNPQVCAGLSLAGLRWALTTGSMANWHPLTWLSHMAVYQVFGPMPDMHHAANLLLHALNSVVLFLVLDGMTGALWRSAWVATLFAVHPAHVESVAWVAERKDVLSALFAFLTIWAYARYTAAPRRGRYLLVVAALALGLAAKQMLVTLPCVLLLLDVWPLRRLAWLTDGHQPQVPGTTTTLAVLVREKLPLLLLAAGASVATVAAQAAGGALWEGLPFSVRLENAPLSYVRYLAMLLWPRGLIFFYPYPAPPLLWQVAAATLLMAATSALAIWSVRRRPYVAVGWFWFVGMLVPVIGLVQVGDQSLADRYTYLPSIGLFIIVAWGVPDLLQSWRRRNLALASAAAVVTVGLMAATWLQIGYWRNTRTLSEHALAVMPDNFVAHLTLANALEKEGQIDAALAHCATALQINPNRWDAHYNYAELLARQGHMEEAVRHYQEALRIWPNSPEVHNNLGVGFVKQGQFDAAIAEYRAAIRLQPDFGEAYANLGKALMRQGNASGAVAAFAEAARLKPSLIGVYVNWGETLESLGRADAAAAVYRAGLQQAPNAAAVADKLARLLAISPDNRQQTTDGR